MNFTGDIVVYRSALEIARFVPWTEADVEEHPTYGKWEYADGWRAAQIRHYGDEDYRGLDREWLVGLADRTGAPAMVCAVFDSEVAHVFGYGTGSGAWDARLDPESAAHQLWSNAWYDYMDVPENAAAFEELDRDESDRFEEKMQADAAAEVERARPEWAAAAVRWAADAGYEVPLEPVIAQFGKKADPFVQYLFMELVELLGLRRIKPVVPAAR